MYSYAVTVYDETTAERCPIFPGVCKRLHWSFTDPAAIEGSFEKKLSGTRIIRDQIKEKILSWVNELERKSIKEEEI